MLRRKSFVAVLACVAVAACGGGGDGGTAPGPALATIQVAVSSSILRVGATANATATGVDASGAVVSLRNLSWTSASPSVATVNASGIITAVGAGTTQIVATSGQVVGFGGVTVRGGWTTAGDATVIGASLESDLPLVSRFGTSQYATMDVICGIASKNFILAIGVPHIITRNGIVAYSGTNIPTASGTWLESSTFHTLFHPGPNSATKTLVSQIASGPDFAIAFGEFNGGNHAAGFRTTGMPAVIAPIQAACPGANVATDEEAANLLASFRSLRNGQ